MKNLPCVVTQELDAWLKREAQEEARAEAEADALHDWLHSSLTGKINIESAGWLYDFYLGDISDTELKHRLKEKAKKLVDKRIAEGGE